MKPDNIHYNFNEIDGHNKAFNFIISPRRDGKSTQYLITKGEKVFKEEKLRTIYFRRDKNDITDMYINSLQGILRKFEKPRTFHYAKTKGEGFINVYDESDNENPYLTVVALNQEKGNFKSLFFPNVANFVMDEFIIDTRRGEKYVDDEVGKIKELYETMNREAVQMRGKPIKCYFLGNPYSMWNPYFVEFGIDPKLLKKGTIVTGKTWAVQRHTLHPELLEQIKKDNPLYDQFQGDAWERYAIEGDPINDDNINLAERPENYFIDAVIIFEGRYYAIWKYRGVGLPPFDFYVSREKELSKRRVVYAFDFKDLILNSRLYSKNDKVYLARFKRSVTLRRVAFADLDCSYTIESLFTAI